MYKSRNWSVILISSSALSYWKCQWYKKAKIEYFFLTSVCLLPLNFLLILSMLSIREQILLRTFLKSFIWFLSRWRTFFLASSFFFFSSLFNQLDIELNNKFFTRKNNFFEMALFYLETYVCWFIFRIAGLHEVIQKKWRIHISYWVSLNCFYEPK